MYSIEKATRNGYTILKENCYLLSRHNPVQEGERFANTFLPTLQKKVVFFGFLPIYHILQLTPHILDFLIIEPDEKLFDFIVKNKTLFWSDKADFILSKRVTAAHFIEMNCKDNFSALKNVSIIESPHSNQFLSEFKSSLRTSIDRGIKSVTTENYFDPIWKINTIKNIKHLKQEDLFLSKPQNSSKTMMRPIIFVSSGPQLKKLFPQIKKIKQHHSVVAVPGALPYLAKNQIVPDYIFSTDGGYSNSIHLKLCSEYRDIPLIAPLTIHPSYSRHFNKVIYFSNDPVQNGELKDLSNGKFNFHTQPMDASVTNAAIRFFYSIGVRKIYLCGADFQTNFYSYHIPGNGVEEFYFNNTNKTNSFESLMSLAYGLPLPDGDHKLNFYKEELKQLELTIRNSYITLIDENTQLESPRHSESSLTMFFEKNAIDQTANRAFLLDLLTKYYFKKKNDLEDSNVRNKAIACRLRRLEVF